MKITMNELKKNLEEYLDSGMWQYEAPCIGKDEAELILNVFKALDKASDILYELNGFDNLRVKNFGRCPFYDYCESIDKCIASKEQWKEWLLNNE